MPRIRLLLPFVVSIACSDDGAGGDGSSSNGGSSGVADSSTTVSSTSLDTTSPSTTVADDSGGSDSGGSDSGDTDLDPCEPFGHFGVPTTMFELPVTDGEGIYYDDVQAAFPEVDWADVDRLYIPGGSYPSLLLGNLPDRDPADPLVITNSGGQVRIGPSDPPGNYLWSIGGGSNWVITGRWDPDSQTGSEDAPGHRCGDYANARGHYGFWSDDAFAQRQYLHMGIAVGDATDFELEYLEIERSGFAGIRLLNSREAGDPEQPMSNVRVHDNYVHDTGGEGIYFGWTGDPPSNRMIGLQVHDNRFVRTGNEALQVQDIADGSAIHHNVIAFAALHWRDNGLGMYQDGNAQISLREGEVSIDHNVFIGGAGTLVSYWSAPQEGDGARHVTFSDNYLADIRNLLLYFGGSSDASSSFEFARNSIRGLDFSYDALDPAATEPGVVFSIGGDNAAPISFVDNHWEGTEMLFSGGVMPTDEGNVNGPVDAIEFVDSGWPADVSVQNLEAWVAVSTLAPGMPARQYEVGERVMFGADMYECIAANTDQPPPDHPESWMALPDPIDDFRVAPGTTYAGIGIR